MKIKKLIAWLFFSYGVYALGTTITLKGYEFFPFNLYICSIFNEISEFIFYNHQYQLGIPLGIIISAISFLLWQKCK